MVSLDRALDAPQRVKVPEGVVQRLLRSVQRDIAELLPMLETRGGQAEAEAVEKLAERAVQEARAMRELIEGQRRRIERELSREDDPQLALDLDDPLERRQRALDRRAWQERLTKIQHELDEQPRRIAASYVVKARRLEPVGLVYLWPATG
jgi:hypothetical protein